MIWFRVNLSLGISHQIPTRIGVKKKNKTHDLQVESLNLAVQLLKSFSHYSLFGQVNIISITGDNDNITVHCTLINISALFLDTVVQQDREPFLPSKQR